MLVCMQVCIGLCMLCVCVCVCVCVQHRNKDGYLEFKKSEGLKKTWKSYHFRVNSTYLLRFKSNDVTS